MIVDVSECEKACEQLGLKLGKLLDGNNCYKHGSGKCRQTKKLGGNGSLICKTSGCFNYLSFPGNIMPH